MICGAYSQIAPGTPSHILESLLSEVYKPVLTHIYQNPSIHLNLFLPGEILEWFELHHPEINMLIADLVKKDQIELLTGAYYQPLLTLLHPKDRSSHIEFTTTFIRKRFGKRPKTLWLFNQMWSSNFVSTMQICSVDRLIISTYSPHSDKVYLDKPFVMQDIGKTIEVFPIHHQIENIIDNYRNGIKSYIDTEHELKNVDFTDEKSIGVVMLNLDHLYQGSNISPSNPSVATFFDRMCALIQQNNRHTQLMNSLPLWDNALAKGYLINGWYGVDSPHESMNSVNEMLTTYGELQHLYGRLVYVTELARMYKKNKDVRKRVENLIMKSQTGAPFVMDSFGGCYRSEYRQYVYKHLNEAENLLSQYEAVTYPREVDIDFDGYHEIVMKSKNLIGIVSPKGGVLRELNYLLTGWNYGDTFSGSPLDVEKNTFTHVTNGIPQSLFNDVLLPHSTEDLASYSKQKGYDTSCNIWNLTFDEKSGDIYTSIDLDNVPFSIGDIEIRKTFQFKSSSVVVQYTVENKGPRQSKGNVATELNLVLGKQKSYKQLYTVEKSKNRILHDENTVFLNLNNFRINDEYNKTMLSIASDVRFTLYKNEYSVDMKTLMGKESLYQYSLFLLSFPFDLKIGEKKTWTIGWRIEKRTVRQSKKELA